MKDSLHKVRKHGNEEDAYNVMQEFFAMTGELSKEDLNQFKRQWQEAVKGDNPSINRFSVVRDAERRMEILKKSYDNIISYNKTLHEQALAYKKETLKDVDPALVKEAEEAYEKLSQLKKPEIKLELESTPKSRRFLKEMEKRHPQDKATKEEKQESPENNEGQEN